MAGLRGHPRLVRHRGLADPSTSGRRWYLPWLLAALLLIGLCGWYTWTGWFDDDPAGPAPSATQLERFVLTDPRGPNCLRLVFAVDVSGSMSDYAAARDAAFSQILPWATQNLRAGDQIAVIDFAAESGVRMPPTPVEAKPGAPANLSVQDGFDTLIAPVFESMKAFPSTSCEVALLLLSDAQIADLPTTEPDGRAALTANGVDHIRLLVPGDDISVPGEWQQSFPAAPPQRFDGLDENATSIVVGRTIADLTDQSLTER